MLKRFNRRPIIPTHWYSSQHVEVFKCALSAGPDIHQQFAQQWQQLDTLFDNLHGLYGILPQLYRQIDKSGIASPLKPALQGVYRRIWIENQLIIKQMRAVSEQLENDNIAYAFAGDLAIAHQLYEKIADFPIFAVRLITDTQHLQNVASIVEQYLPEHNLKNRKSHYLPNGVVWSGGEKPFICIQNGVAEADDLSNWHINKTDGFPCLTAPALILLDIAQTTGKTPSPHRLFAINSALQCLNSTEFKQLQKSLRHLSLIYPYWQTVAYLYDILEQKHIEPFFPHLRGQYSEYMEYVVNRLLRKLISL